MNLTDLAELGRLAEHRTSRQEIADLWRLGEAALADANVEAISLDRRYGLIMDEEIPELIETVESFRDEVLAWLQAHYPDMQPPR